MYIDPLWLMDLMKCVVRHDLLKVVNNHEWFFERVQPNGKGGDFEIMKRNVAKHGLLDRRVVAALWTHPPASNSSTRGQEALESLLPSNALDDILPSLCDLMAEFMIAVPIGSGGDLLVPALLPPTIPREVRLTMDWKKYA